MKRLLQLVRPPAGTGGRRGMGAALLALLLSLVPLGRCAPVHAQTTASPPLASQEAASQAAAGAPLVRLAPAPLPPLAPPVAALIAPDSLSGLSVALPSPWTLDLVGNLNASQAAYSNWTEGGLNTLALTVAFEGEAIRTDARWKQTYAANVALGFIQQDTLTVRKADDRLRLSSTLQYRGNGFFHTFGPTLAAGLRTQFLAGFNYDENPFADERPLPVRVSGFLSPVTLTQSAGLTYEPAAWLDQRLSLGLKEVFVTHERLRMLYGLSPSDGARYEAGLESTTELNHRPFEDVRLQSSLRLFAAFNRSDAPDMVWENRLSLSFNEWLSLDFALDAVYDGNVTQALQLREVVSLGASIEMI